MKPICSELQERLAEEGAQALRSDAAAQRHLEECGDCFRVLEQLSRLDAALAAMPAHDAADQVVSDLLDRVKADALPAQAMPAEPFAPPRPAGRPWLWALATAASIAVAAVLVTPSLMRARIASPPRTVDAVAIPLAAATPAPEAGKKGDRELAKEQREQLRALGYLAEDKLPAAPASPAPAAPAKPKQEEDVEVRTYTEREQAGVRGDALDSRNAKVVETGKDRGTRSSEGVPGGVVGGVSGGMRNELVGAVRVGGTVAAPKRIREVKPAYPRSASETRVEGVVLVEIVIDAAGKVQSARVVRSVPALDAAAIQAVYQWLYEPTVRNGRPVPVTMTVPVEFRLPAPTSPTPDPVREFLDERSATEVPFQPATGYWANTYLPGDPVLRLLRARLQGSPLRLHEAAAQPSQPFDPPMQSGLALYLSADRRALDKPSRMLLQIGLRGSPRSAGHRPPMSVALVLDLRGEQKADAAAGMRALALAFAEARETGDRFSLVVAGPNGGLLVPPDKFKHGPLAVAFERLIGSTAPSGPALDLPGAIAAALIQASQCQDPDAALGGSAVVLVTAQPPGDAVGTVLDLAHQGAVAGIPTSVVSVGPGAPSAELDRVALAGQGSRRQLEARSDAPRLVEAELAAASDVVARAVRLRIRLAPHVRLVEVVGSRRLDEAQAQRVREAERSVDLRLSRLLGIDSDRGEDEDGIQVVIPSFHAGDDHVILLDVVADGPGALADVSVRYKDVAFLRNGSARASLRLPAGAAAPGPIERNVLKNLLALRLAQGFASAGAALDAGDAALASALVGRASSLRAALLERIPGLARDGELLRDVALLEQYSRALAGGGPAGPELADSLRYAGRLKQLSRPASRATGTL